MAAAAAAACGSVMIPCSEASRLHGDLGLLPNQEILVESGSFAYQASMYSNTCPKRTRGLTRNLKRERERG